MAEWPNEACTVDNITLSQKCMSVVETNRPIQVIHSIKKVCTAVVQFSNLLVTAAAIQQCTNWNNKTCCCSLFFFISFVERLPRLIDFDKFSFEIRFRLLIWQDFVHLTLFSLAVRQPWTVELMRACDHGSNVKFWRQILSFLFLIKSLRIGVLSQLQKF